MNDIAYHLSGMYILLEQYLKIHSQLDEKINSLKSLDLKNQELEFIEKCNKDIQDIFLHKDNNAYNVINCIVNYLRLNCNHNWIADVIDIDLEKSMSISYCEFCGLTNN